MINQGKTSMHDLRDVNGGKRGNCLYKLALTARTIKALLLVLGRKMGVRSLGALFILEHCPQEFLLASS